MTEHTPNSSPEEHPFTLEIDAAAREHLVLSLREGGEAAWALMGQMMENLEAQIRGNSAEEITSLFFAQAAIYFEAGLNDAGISALNDAHIYAHNMNSIELAQSVRDMITSRGGVVLYEPN